MTWHREYVNTPPYGELSVDTALLGILTPSINMFLILYT